MTETAAPVCGCTPTVIEPTPTMAARGFVPWLHHGSRCPVTVAKQQPIEARS